MKGVLIFVLFLSAYVGAQSYNPIGKGCNNAYYIGKDCDGYGVASPLGVDADNNDPEVNTPQTVIAKYGNLTNFLHHLGYYPERIFFIATDGDDDTGEVDNINKPYKTWDKVKPLLQPGDMVIYREGTYGGITANNLKGTADKPITVIAYPGEKVVIDGAYDSIGVPYTNYLVSDEFILDNSENEYGMGINGHLQKQKLSSNPSSLLTSNQAKTQSSYPQCQEGRITSPCQCGNKTYNAGFCCRGIWFDPSYENITGGCPSGNFYFVESSKCK